jgi:hypothetical protein
LTGDYFDIRYCTRSGAGSFTVTNSQDSGSNSGITFSTTFDFYKRYWVGDGGTFTDTGHWSGISGGSSGAPAPTTTEAVYFDASSFTVGSQTVLLAATVTCKSMDWTGVTNSPTFDVNSRAINITGGNYTLVSGMTYSITSGLLTISGTCSLNIDGKSIKGLTVTGTVTLTSNVICTPIIHTNGTFDTAGYDISCTTFTSSGSTARTLTLGDTVITMSGTSDFTFSGSNLTFNCNTSTIICGGDFNGLSKVFNNVELTGNSAISGSNTFNDLKFDGESTYTFATTTNQTVTSISNTTAYNVGVTWTSAGTFTITSAAALSLSYYKIGKCTFAGAGSLAVLGLDNGSNSNITFTNFPFTDRFWVGGTGTISDTTHLSGISGGVGGASALTSSNNIFFDANSFTGAGQVVTIGAATSCKSMDWTGATNTPNLYQNGNYILNVFGGLTFISDMTYTGTYAGQIEFEATSGSWTVTTAGKTLYSLKFQGTASTATWTLQDDVILTVGLTHTTGTLNTNGKDISCTTFTCNGTGTRTLTLGDSVITCSGIITFTSTGITFNKDTSKFKAGANFVGAGLTFYDLEIVGTCTISGNNTFNDLILNKLYTATFTTGSNQTVTAMSGAGDTSNLIRMRSTSVGYTITSATTLVLNYYNIEFCTFAGAGSMTVTNGFDMGSNFNITWSSYYNPYGKFWVGGSGTWDTSDKTHWADSSGGAGGADVPTREDTVYFDVNSFTSGSKAVTVGMDVSCYGIDSTGALASATVLSSSRKIKCHSTLKIVNGFYILTTLELYAPGGSFEFWLGAYGSTINQVSGSWSLSNDSQFQYYVLTGGDLDFNGFDITCRYFFTSSSADRKSITGTSTITTYIFELGAGADITYDFTNVDIVFEEVYIAGYLNFKGLGYTYKSLTSPNTEYPVYIYGDNTFTGVFDVRLAAFNSGSVQTIGSLASNGTYGLYYIFESVTPSSAYGITCTDTVYNYQFTDCAVTGTITANDSADMGGNTNITFTTNERYWIGGSGNIDDPNHYSRTSGGAATADGRGVPWNLHDVFFDGNSGLSGATVTFGDNKGIACNNLDFTGSGAFTISFYSLGDNYFYVAGIKLHASITIGTNYPKLGMDGSPALNVTASIGIDVAGKGLYSVYFYNVDRTWDLAGDLNAVMIFEVKFYAGTLNTNGYDIWAYYFNFVNGNDITLNLGDSLITVGAWWRPTYTAYITINAGTSKFLMNGDSGNFYGYAYTYYDLEVTGNNVVISGSNTFHDLIFTPDKTTKIAYGTTQTLTGELPANGTAGHLITIKSNLDGTAWNLVKTKGTIGVDYYSIRDSRASGGADFYAGANSVDISGNTGWIFTAPPVTGFNIFFGVIQIANIYLGSVEITNVYKGSTPI